MSESDTLVQALADVSERRATLQAEYDRIGAELSKLRLAENALRAIVENVPLEAGLAVQNPTSLANSQAQGREAPRASGRGSRGPRANSAKGRLKALLESAGPQGLSHAQITRHLSDVAPGTLNTYLSMMVTSGEVVRRGDFYASERPGRQELAEGNDGRDHTPEHDDREQRTDLREDVESG
ncbi:hypothetical protein [Methylobacterium nodulans]|uniref:Uncharacterized protein n=1 Tax=Methylobacterium nodulans (strain LMG 21967 / CNCM I-2342 / ORS 2060) TaxID=460265 RepID=B8IAR3_METNO|nr:hypothetical protein [Methylobacterium nodulans]ACL61108.1 conserved hypothetical protein [Methylobacterium nodulans ORS 2060]